MKIKKSSIITLIIMCLFCYNVLSQQVICSMGSCLQNNSGSISFSVGEPIIATLSTASGIVTQGFHQTKLTVTAINENFGNSMSVKVYPNPTAEVLCVFLDFDEISHIRLILYDLNGRILAAINADKELMDVDLSGYLPGTYILKIHKGSRAIGTYKIVKTE